MEGNVKQIMLVALTLALLGGAQAMAKDINFIAPITQSEFRSLTKQAGAALSYKNLAPAEPLGITGFDLGVEVSAVDIKNGSGNYWDRAFGGDAPDFLLVPKLRVRKGLPLGIDIGAMYSYLPNSNVRVYGFELSKAILEGSTATPALGIRGTYSRLSGVKDLDLQTAGVDLSISKGIFFLTPYAGVGANWINSKATGDLRLLTAGLLKTESIWQPRGFAGLKVSPLPFFAITGEVEYQVRPIYSLKAAIGF